MKNIIFDLGGVIITNTPISILNNLNINEETYNQLKIFFQDWEKLNLGEETLEEKYNECGFSKEYDDLYKNILLNYYKYREINMELINCINKLKSNGYNIYILSNNVKECFEYYKNLSVFKNIDDWTISCDYHATKDDGRLFDIFIKEFNLDPSECYFIDNLSVNIQEAIKRGFKGYVFNEDDDIDKLYNDMRNNNINI